MSIFQSIESGILTSGLLGGEANKVTHWAVSQVLGVKKANAQAGAEAQAVTGAAVASIIPNATTPEQLVSTRVSNVATAAVAAVQSAPAGSVVNVPTEAEIAADVKSDFDELVKGIVSIAAKDGIKINGFALDIVEVGTDFGIDAIVKAEYAKHPELINAVEDVKKLEDDFTRGSGGEEDDVSGKGGAA